MSQDSPQDQPPEETAGLDAAYAQWQKHDNSGMRALAGLFLLEHEFRRVPDQPHLARLVVNRLNRFAPYDCAIFWTCSPSGRVYDVTISGIVKSEDTEAILDWARALGQWLNKTGFGNTQITPTMVDTQMSMANWPVNLAKSGLYVPMRRQDGKLRGGLVLLRASPWAEPVRIMLDQLAEAAAYTVDALDAGVHGRGGGRDRLGKYIRRLAVVALLALSFFVPVPVNVDVPARLAVSTDQANAPRGPTQIDIRVPPQGAMALKPGSRLKTNYEGTQYELEVEHITPWLGGLLADRQLRARFIAAPDDLALPSLSTITIENASVPLPLYLLRGPIAMMRGLLGLDPSN
jgi:hypothetical protein